MTTNRFERTRADHAQERAEDYVEMIATLTQEMGEARAVDLAQRLGISHVTVSKTIQRLQREGYVSSLPYRSIFLTEKGSELAHRAQERHELVHSFLIRLGVPEPSAELDTEGIEHHVSDETLAAMRAFVERR